MSHTMPDTFDGAFDPRTDDFDAPDRRHVRDQRAGLDESPTGGLALLDRYDTEPLAGPLDPRRVHQVEPPAEPAPALVRRAESLRDLPKGLAIVHGQWHMVTLCPPRPAAGALDRESRETARPSEREPSSPRLEDPANYLRPAHWREPAQAVGPEFGRWLLWARTHAPREAARACSRLTRS